ncbi:hypothetical protein [Nocardiopsis sp. FR4]|uniref:hypothetical protein n=1 Tax=Nocardiopsis sp. FR4 TaxID=2605985 RepID=UPI00135AF572|nr:hypothetical protein [Nocardiopsis sp. FR4]
MQLSLIDEAGVEEGRRLREEALAGASADGWDNAVIDQAIRFFAASGRRFSANDVRPLLPLVRRAAIGARFMAASRRGVIRRVDSTPSTDPGTHAHRITVWEGTGM